MAKNRASFQQTNSVTVVSVSVFRDLRTQSHQVLGSTHFRKYDDHKWRSHGEARRYPPCRIIESEDFSDLDKEIACASWTQIGGRGQTYILY